MNDDRDLYSGMIRLHILHHAEREFIFGAGMSEELARHGYKISPGTMYPILHGLEKRGYLHSSKERSGKSLRPSIGLQLPGDAPSIKLNSACGNFLES
jgi:PadR family transcriptional regulator PadR